MRISDWSSDVCSSDLWTALPFGRAPAVRKPADAGSSASLRPFGCGPPPWARPVGRISPPTPAPGEAMRVFGRCRRIAMRQRSEEHTSELQSLMRISYAVFCLKKKKKTKYKKFQNMPMHLVINVFINNKIENSYLKNVI